MECTVAVVDCLLDKVEGRGCARGCVNATFGVGGVQVDGVAGVGVGVGVAGDGQDNDPVVTPSS